MIAILGGTFDPIHLGHLEAAKKIQELNFFKKVSLLPSYQPVQKQNCLFDLNQRIEMIESALDEYPTIELDYDEINSKNPSYMIDTLKFKKFSGLFSHDMNNCVTQINQSPQSIIYALISN